MEGQYNMRSPAVKRLMKEAQELKDPTELYFVQPLEDNLFEWHFTIRGPGESEFDGGIYHGRIILPPDYPMKPPSIILLTPNGRFETNKKICLSISGHHPESWQPSWSIRTALLAIIGFMPTHGAGAIGSLDYTTDERKTLAKRCSDPEVFILKALRVNFSSSELKSPLSLLSQVLKTAKVFPKYLWLVVESQEETDQNKRAFPTASANNSVSALRITSKERRFICRSQTWKCPVCGDISNTLAPLTEASKETSMEAKALASQIDFQSEKEKKARMSSNDKEPTKPLGPPTQTTSNSAATQVPAGVNQDGAMPNYFPVPPLPPMMVQYPFPYRFPCTSENPQNKDPSSTSASPPFLPPYFPPMSYQNFSTLGTQQPKEMPAFHDTLSRNISDSQTSTLSSAFKPPSLQPTNCSNTGVTKPQSTPATAAASVSPKQSASTSQQKNESERSSSLSTPSLNESSGLRQRVIRANSQTYTTTVDQTSRAMSQQEVQSGGTASLILIVLLVMAIGILLLRRFYFSQTSNFNYHP